MMTPVVWVFLAVWALLMVVWLVMMVLLERQTRSMERYLRTGNLPALLRDLGIE